MLKFTTILIAILLSTTVLFSQKKEANRPKIGLVLSGGGAKGFAHIGAIKLLEECGIIPDYITGTSMGSIIGALYAMGYTPEEIKNLSDSTDWESVLSNTIPLNNITYAEKQYYGSYWTELDVTKKGVSLPGGLIRGQNLYEELSFLSHPVHGIDNFLDFPIPYTCVATDIERGIPVALNHGSIVDAIRASMAIPTAFTPVEIDSLLLIDGGWTRNLPVQEALDMGADIIISVDVGAGLNSKEDLKSMISILDQTAWILSSQDTKKQLEMSDYVISPPVRSFSTFDFDNLDTIIAYGYSEAAKQRTEFEALAKKIYPTGKNEVKITKPRDRNQFKIASIQIIGTKKTSKRFAKGRLKIDPEKEYSIDEINHKIDDLFGTLYYKTIQYEIVSKKDGTNELLVYVEEDNPTKLKLSIYYDTENSVGLNLNITARNLLFQNSRLFIDAFLSENPVISAKYLKYLGHQQNTILYTKGRFTKDARFQWENLYGNPSEYKYNELLGSIGVAYTKRSWIFGLEYGYQGALMKPGLNADTIINRWRQSSQPLKAFVQLNSLDRIVFPTKGILFSLSGQHNFNIEHRAILNSDINVPQSIIDSVTRISPFFSFHYDYKQYFKIANMFSLIVNSSMQLSSQTDIGFNDYVKVGGIAPILHSATDFWGGDRNQFNVVQAFTAGLGFQWNFYSEFYFIGRINYLNLQYPMNFLTPQQSDETFIVDGKNYTDLFGLGGELAYKSPIGPIRLVVHQNQYSGDLNFFVGVGFNINKVNRSF